MAILPKAIRNLIESFERLPSIGPKSAARLTFYLLHVPQHELDKFADSVRNLKLNTVTCAVCFNVSESDPCLICSNPGRAKETICVVEQPIDVLSFEKTGKFTGVYHVLHGSLNPLANIGPEEIRISELMKRATNGVREIILATNPNMEGEATAMYVKKELKVKSALQNSRQAKLKITRLAHGLPVGGDVEYADEVTLGRALEGRREY